MDIGMDSTGQDITMCESIPGQSKAQDGTQYSRQDRWAECRCLDYSEKNVFYFSRNRTAKRPSLLILHVFEGGLICNKTLPALPRGPFRLAIRPPSQCNNGPVARPKGSLCFLDKALWL